MDKKNWLLLLLIVCCYKVGAQSPKTSPAINSKVSIPVTISGKAIQTFLQQSTPERQFLTDKNETLEIDFVFNVSDGETRFNTAGILHTIQLSGGEGLIKKRTCVNAWNGNICSPWLTMRFKEIIGKATFAVDAQLKADYSVAATGKLKASLENLEWAGMNMTDIMKTFGWQYF